MLHKTLVNGERLDKKVRQLNCKADRAQVLFLRFLFSSVCFILIFLFLFDLIFKKRSDSTNLYFLFKARKIIYFLLLKEDLTNLCANQIWSWHHYSISLPQRSILKKWICKIVNYWLITIYEGEYLCSQLTLLLLCNAVTTVFLCYVFLIGFYRNTTMMQRVDLATWPGG